MVYGLWFGEVMAIVILQDPNYHKPSTINHKLSTLNFKQIKKYYETNDNKNIRRDCVGDHVVYGIGFRAASGVSASTV